MVVNLNPRPAGVKNLALFNELHGLLAEPTPGQLAGIAQILETRQRRIYPPVADLMQSALGSISDPDHRCNELLFVALAFGHLRALVLHPETGLVHKISREAWNFWADKLTREAAITGEFPDPGDFPGFNAVDRRFAGFPLLIERGALKIWSKKRSKKEVERFARQLVQEYGRLRRGQFNRLVQLAFPDLGRGRCTSLWRAVRTPEMMRPGRPRKGETSAEINPPSDSDWFSCRAR